MLFFVRRDAISEVNHLPTPELVADVADMELRNLNIALDVSQCALVVWQWVVLDACCVVAVVKQLLAHAVIRVKLGHPLNFRTLRVLADHPLVVPIGNQKHRVIERNAHLFKRNVFDKGDAAAPVPRHRQCEAVEQLKV